MAELKITIDDSKVADFKIGFLKSVPKPSNYAGTDLQWIKEWVISNLKLRYAEGKETIARESSQPVIDDTVIL